MMSGSKRILGRRLPTRSLLASLVAALAVTASAPDTAWAQVTLKLGDILVAEPGTASISVVDATTGQKTLISLCRGACGRNAGLIRGLLLPTPGLS
jgi:hypothetical protein